VAVSSAFTDDGPEATRAALTRLVRFYSAGERPSRSESWTPVPDERRRRSSASTPEPDNRYSTRAPGIRVPLIDPPPTVTVS
jgi:hypothetical protein